MLPDYYYTIERSASAEFKDRGSKFIAYAFPVAGVVDFKAEVIEVLREGRLEPSHAVVSTVRGALKPAISRVPDAIGRVEDQRSLDSFRA